MNTSEYYSTTTALDAVYLIDPANSSYSTGFAWLTGQVVSPTDYLSRRIIALKRAGADVSGELASLILYRNPDGGWGGETSYLSDNLDTALALQALKAANYSDYSILFRAVDFLIANQNADGGWGFVAGYDSNVFVTAHVLKVLPYYNNLGCSARSAIDKSIAYLLSKQNSDGGFGSSPSSVYETALAFDALIAAGANISTIDPLTDRTTAQGATGYLTTTQLANGSWNDDPYSTALALQALANIRPNLTVSSLSLSKPMPQEGEQVTITATVRNTGLDAASNVIVRFYSGDPASGGTQIGTDQVVPSLAIGSSSQAAISFTFPGTGSRTIFAVADPDNLISETLETDNKASSRLWVATMPDLAVFSEDLKPVTYVPAPGTAFTLEYKIRNLGETAADAFGVNLYDGDPSQGGALLQTANISGIAGGGVSTGTLGVTLTGEGAHTVYLAADAGAAIQEISETNNTGSVTVQVGGAQSGADLSVTSADITLDPSRPAAGQTVQISARVRNTGTDTAFGFVAELFDGSPESVGALIHSETLSLAPGVEQTITKNWSIPSGIHEVHAVLDRQNKIVESNETNNRASVAVMTDMVDISLSATDLTFTPSRPVMGDSVALAVTARNTGISNTGAFTLALYNGDPAAGGVLLQSFPVSNIPGDGSQSVAYTFTAQPQTYRFYAVADTENVVTELYESNNQAVRSLMVKGPGETYGPDLVPVKIDLSGTGTDPRTLAISGNALVTFQNKGDNKITASFGVLVFEDRDNDGRYTEGVDAALGSATNALSLWPEGANMLSVPLSGTVKFLHSPLYALIDSGDAILEQDETNNLLVSCKDCEVRPASLIQPVVKWRQKGFAVTTPPVIANLSDSNNDGKIDHTDIPDIVYIFNANSISSVITAKGATGEIISSITDTNHPTATTSYLAAGDIDGDRLPEIIVPRSCSSGGCGLLAYKHDGALLWDNKDAVTAWNAAHPVLQATIHENGVPVLADINGSGMPVIIMGTTVINNDGSIKSVGVRQAGGKLTGSGSFNGNILYASTVADLEMDGNPKIVAGNTAYNSDGTIHWFNSALTDGINAVGNLDDDSYPEVVLITNVSQYPYVPGGRIYLLDHDGHIKWGPVYLRNLEPNEQSSGLGSPPVIADFDGDGQAEIGIKGFNKYFILDKNGSVKQTLSIPYDTTRGYTGGFYSAATVFDLNGDDHPQVLINSDGYFRIFDGKTGVSLYQEQFGAYWNTYQNAIVADVDGDGQAEIAAVGYGPANSNSDIVRIYASGDPNHPWVPARKIWNQPSYHVTNVNDDGSIPQYEAPSWLLNNTYRTQAVIGLTPNPYLTPNLTASYLRGSQDSTGVDLTVRIGNGGAKEAASGVAVTFYDGSSTGQVIGTTSTTTALKPGEYQDLSVTWTGASAGLHTITAVVDKAGTVSECDENDNEASLSFDVKGAGTFFGPDLAPVKLDLSGAATDPQTLAISGAASVTFQNRGDTTISAPFDIVVFEDTDGDGRYTQGVDHALGTASNSMTLLPGGANMLAVPLSGSVQFPGSPLAAVIDSGNAVPEQDETNNILFSASGCKLSSVLPISVKREWVWKWQGMTYRPPVVVNLTDDNGDGKYDQNDVPSIVFVAMHEYLAYGKLYAVRGDTGQVIFSVNNRTTDPIMSSSSVTAGDINHDGITEIIVEKYSSNGSYMAYDRTGTKIWDNSALVDAWNVAHPAERINVLYTLPSLADIDGDGNVEIIAGATVFNADGSVRCSRSMLQQTGIGAFGGNWISSDVADLDRDGRLEVIAGSTVYNNDCTVKWWRNDLTDGLTAVGNLDDDASPEIVLVTTVSAPPYISGGRIYLLDHDGGTKWGPVYLANLEPGAAFAGLGSPPVIADFDGDGLPEIGVKGTNKFFILDQSGNVKQTLSIPYRSGGFTSAPTVFDLNGDGRPEVTINSDYFFRIFDGATGAELYSESFGGTGNNPQNVIVADVDGDDQAEIVAIGSSSTDGMRVYGSNIAAGASPWVNARRIWNEHSYHVTNVNDDGSIPRYEAPSWLLNNTYRCQAATSVSGQGTGAPRPNLTASYPRVVSDGTSLNMTVRVANSGAEAVLSGAMVFFHDGDPATDGIVVGTAVTSKDLRPGEYQDIAYSWSDVPSGAHRIVTVVDPNNAVAECREDDNQAQIDYTVHAGLPDLALASGDITIPAGVHAEGDLVPVTVRISNTGAVPASNVEVSLSSGNPALGGTPLTSSKTAATIDAGGSVSLVFTIDTLGRAGDTVVYAAADPQNSIAESSEANNSAFFTLAVQPPVLPNLSITTDGVQLSSAAVQGGENVTITATVMNRGASVSNIPVRIYNGDPAAGGSLVSERTIYPVMELGQTATVTANLMTTGLSGEQNIFVVVDPANGIVESREDDNAASKALFIQAAGLTSTVTLDKASYQANEAVNATIAIVNATAGARTLIASLSVRDGAGNLIAVISPGDPLNIAPSGTVSFSRNWNTGKTLAGSYSVVAETAEGGRTIARATADLSIAPATGLDATVTADKIAYNPKETVALSATVTSRSVNYLFENLTARLTVNADGAVGEACTETKTISLLMPEASYTFKSYCPAATARAGTYTARLEVLSGQTVLAASSAGFEVRSTAQTGAGLAGTIAATVDPVYQGRDEAFSISVTNSGIDDLAGLTVSVIVADPDTGAMRTEAGGQTITVGQGQTVAGSVTASTLNLDPKKYLAILQVRTAEMTAPRTLASALFEVKPGIEVTKRIPDVRNVLVWVNNNCGSRISDCGLESLETALQQVVTDYRIVLDKKEFADELGNIFYTDIVILGDHHPLEDHVADALAARVAEGAGLLSSLFNRQSLNEPVLGIKFTGSLPGEGYVVEIAGDGLGMQGTFPSAGRVLKIEALNPDEAAAWVTVTDKKGTARYPAALKRQHGNGRVLFLAFDLAASSANIPGFASFLRNALDAVHTPLSAPFRQGQPVPVEVTVRSLGAAFDIRISEQYPAGTGIYDPAGGQWITVNPWVRDLRVEPNEERSLLFYALLPEQGGTYTLLSEIGYLDDGAYAFYQNVSLDLVSRNE